MDRHRHMRHQSTNDIGTGVSEINIDDSVRPGRGGKATGRAKSLFVGTPPPGFEGLGLDTISEASADSRSTGSHDRGGSIIGFSSGYNGPMHNSYAHLKRSVTFAGNLPQDLLEGDSSHTGPDHLLLRRTAGVHEVPPSYRANEASEHNGDRFDRRSGNHGTHFHSHSAMEPLTSSHSLNHDFGHESFSVLGNSNDGRRPIDNDSPEQYNGSYNHQPQSSTELERGNRQQRHSVHLMSGPRTPQIQPSQRSQRQSIDLMRQAFGHSIFDTANDQQESMSDNEVGDSFGGKLHRRAQTTSAISQGLEHTNFFGERESRMGTTDTMGDGQPSSWHRASASAVPDLSVDPTWYSQNQPKPVDTRTIPPLDYNPGKEHPERERSPTPMQSSHSKSEENSGSSQANFQQQQTMFPMQPPFPSPGQMGHGSSDPTQQQLQTLHQMQVMQQQWMMQWMSMQQMMNGGHQQMPVHNPPPFQQQGTQQQGTQQQMNAAPQQPQATNDNNNKSQAESPKRNGQRRGQNKAKQQSNLDNKPRKKESTSETSKRNKREASKSNTAGRTVQNGKGVAPNAKSLAHRTSLIKGGMCEQLADFKALGKPLTMEEVLGHVVEFSRDSHGSRDIQKKMETASREEQALLVNEVLSASISLMQDLFGNYVMQNFLQNGSPTIRSTIAATMKGSMVMLSTHPHGCRVVQKAIEVLPLQARNDLLRELLVPSGNIIRGARDPHGTHVLQKATSLFQQDIKDGNGEIENGATSSQTLLGYIEEVISDDFMSFAVHPHACRLVQRALGKCDPDENMSIETMLQVVQDNYYSLSLDQHGNFVLQHILECGTQEQVEAVQAFVCSRVVELAQHKFGSHLVEKCLTSATQRQADRIVSQLIKPTLRNAQDLMDNETDGDGSVLMVLMKDPYANFVVQRAFDVSSESIKLDLAREIREKTEMLQRFTYGRHILGHINRAFAQHNTSAEEAEGEPPYTR